ncbi:hypothetical protein ABIE89_008446 [Bradyrhizobium niftali]|uniref:hypothetical protein n=1 Tax=Bradyrhizobium niftali TaxID=2560055 RepID=UPI003836E35E
MRQSSFMTNTPQAPASSPALRAAAGGTVVPAAPYAQAIGLLNAIERTAGDQIPEAGEFPRMTRRKLSRLEASVSTARRHVGLHVGMIGIASVFTPSQVFTTYIGGNVALVAVDAVDAVRFAVLTGPPERLAEAHALAAIAR